jgi:hypothetical protein
MRSLQYRLGMRAVCLFTIAVAAPACADGQGADVAGLSNEPVGHVSQALSPPPTFYIDGSAQVVGPSPWVDVTAFGASSTCGSDSISQINTAMAYLQQNGGGTLFFPPGTYCISAPIVVSQASYPGLVKIVGAGPSTVIDPLPGKNPAYLIQVSGSYGGVQNLQLNCSSASGITAALGLVPSSTTATTLIIHNVLSGLLIQGCGASTYGIELQAGTSFTNDAGLHDSGLWTKPLRGSLVT